MGRTRATTTVWMGVLVSMYAPVLIASDTMISCGTSVQTFTKEERAVSRGGACILERRGVLSHAAARSYEVLVISLIVRAEVVMVIAIADERGRGNRLRHDNSVLLHRKNCFPCEIMRYSAHLTTFEIIP